jgi:hypothetical protein
MPDQSQTQPSSSDQQPYNTSTMVDDDEHTPTTYRRPATAAHRVPVPVHNATQWFSGPNMQNERSSRMEKVVSSLLRRSFRPMSSYQYAKSK